jgi:hypothetical protein
MELETERDPGQRQWLRRQLENAKLKFLNVMRADREQLERENQNLEAALEKIKEMENRRKK